MDRHTSVENLQRAIDRMYAADDCIQEAFRLLTLTDLDEGPNGTTIGKGLLAWLKYLEALIAERTDSTDGGGTGDA